MQITTLTKTTAALRWAALTTTFLVAAGLAPCAASSEASFPLTKGNLGDILTNMGLRPERLNEKRYRMVIDRGGIKFSITASISNDGSEVWLNTYVAEVADIAKLPPSVMDKLLKASNDYGPSHFTFVAGEKPEARSLYLHRALDNHGLNPAAIREAIDSLASDVVSTQPLWDSSKWPASR
jgi:hypothetical protein